MQAPSFLLVLLLVAGSSATGQVADSKDRALAHYRAGQNLLAAEVWGQAAEEFSRAIELDPDLALAHYGLGRAHLGAKRYQNAVRALEACRRAFRSRTDARQRQEYVRELRRAIHRLHTSASGSSATPPVPPTDVGRYHQRKLRELEMELTEMERLVRAGRSVSADLEVPAFVSLSLGSAHLRSGSLADAEREFRAAIDANPEFGEAHNNLAVLYMMVGRFDDADRHMRLAEKFGVRVPSDFKDELKAKKKAAAGTP